MPRPLIETGMPRYLTRGLQVALDFGVLSVAFWFGFLFRFEFQIPDYWARVAVVCWPYVILFEYGVLVVFGVPRFSWRYVSMRESLRIAVALFASSALMVALRFGLAHVEGALSLAVIPLAVASTQFFLAF